MIHNLLILILALVTLIYGASLSAKYAERIAESFHMSKYTVGFIVVSFVSILPETFIALNAAFQGEPSLGIGTLFGSNVIDLTLILAILVFLAGKRGLRVEKPTMRKLRIYPLFLTIPLLLGLDGRYERAEGFAFIIIGIIFYYYMFRHNVGIASRSKEIEHRWKNVVFFIGSMALLLLAANVTSESAVALAKSINVSPILIGVLIVSFGTTLPELSFSAKAVRNKKDALAIGDVFGSVLADATIVVGIVAAIVPFSFPQIIAYVAGGFMVFASIIITLMLHNNYRVTRREAVLLVAILVCYIGAELAANAFFR